MDNCTTVLNVKSGVNMNKQLTFDATIIGQEGTEAAGLYVPFSVQEVFGKKGMVKIKATFDGHPYRGSLMPHGEGKHALIVRKDVQKAIGKYPGDVVHIVLEEDTEERIVVVPSDLQALLDENPEAKAIFDKFAYTHRKEYVRWIEEAKRQETREKRLVKAIEMIASGKKFS